MIPWLNKKFSKMNAWDIFLVNLAVIAGMLFIITIWSVAMNWVQSVNPWYFLIAWIIFGIRPFYITFLKKDKK